MKKVNTLCAKDEAHPLRITRAKARALESLGGMPPPSRPSIKNELKNVPQVNSKRTISDVNKTSAVAPTGLQHKRRAVLRDVTNIRRKSSYNKGTDATKLQVRAVNKNKSTKQASNVSVGVSSSLDNVKEKLTEGLSAISMVEPHETKAAAALNDKEATGHCVPNGIGEHGTADATVSMQDPVKSETLSSPNKDKHNKICEKLGTSNCLEVVDIDSEMKDPLIWSSYAPDICNKIRVTELERRPLTNYMEKLQRDINPSMRGILIDWLVEVSEEYKLVPDTLYLTVNLIDRFLSTNLVQKHRLQLVGVTCMLIASKYEEICAPRVEEFCLITDNAYTKDEVLKMEREVLNTLHFQLSVPTTKTFLRRFIQAAQSSYKVPCLELEFLANYLVELTLVEYSFLKFLPSLIAASAVFLARWTLNHSEHPWNPTLEHYTNYKASELKTVILTLEGLQLNTKGSSLNAVREKYKQQKFNCVANLSPKPVQALFQAQV